MGTLIIEFYCLPYRDLLLIFAAATLLFLWLRMRFDRRPWWKIAVAASAALFICLIVIFTLANREPGSQSVLLLTPFHSYREMEATGNIEILRSNFMNGILFYPSGLLAVSLLPGKWPRWVRILVVFLLFAGLSIGIEYYQYVSGIGRAEIDDVIHNVLGAFLGAVAGALPFPRSTKERS